MIALVRRPATVFSSATEVTAFEGFVHELFSKRRKQLGAILRDAGGREGPWPPGVEPTMRPEALDPTTLLALFHMRGALFHVRGAEET
jgi:16S rRNA A1518/A1519 N6-dimethyltransferase RsmA/KsgA/DIM1 with predicted DNA glycosylase/AP lyase activity